MSALLTRTSNLGIDRTIMAAIIDSLDEGLVKVSC